MIELPAEEQNILNDVMQRALIGHLGLIDASGYPRVVPLNFVFVRKSIHFHSGCHGKKFGLLIKSPKITFSVDIPYSFIPSYWINPKRACSVTQFFKSVLIRGRSQLVEDLGEKISALQALMEKYQPEKKYLPLEPGAHEYSSAFEKVAIFRINFDHISVKNYFGQRFDSSKLNQIRYNLHERDKPLDRATFLEMKKALPYSTA